jgi:hypothetical protein
MADGPTTEGSIVAYLRLDSSDWDRKLDEAAAKARELARVDPNIRVTTDTAKAIAELDAVKAAEDRVAGTLVSKLIVSRQTVGSAKDDTFDASAELQAAQANVLAAATARADAAIEKLTIDQEADNEAMRQASTLALKESIMMEALAAAERNAASASDSLKAAQDRGAVSSAREAAAVDADRQKKDQANVTNNNTISRMGLIAAAIGAAVPVAGELTGAAVALAGGLGGMGAAGILAVLGIKDAMAEGTDVGNQYNAGMHVLLDDLHQLEATATAGVLNGFTQSVDTVNAAMPELNNEIRVFSGELGTAGSIVTNGVVTALRVMNPLFVQAGAYVDELAAGFTRWTRDGGLQRFTQEAITALPQVTGAIGSLLNGAMALIQAFAPLGPVLLGTVNLVGQLASALGMLGPALPPIVAAAATAFAMFSQWKTLGPILEEVAWRVGAVGLAADIAEGPVGWIIGAASLLAGGLLAVAQGAAAATQATEDYTAAVQQDNGVIGQHTQAQAAENLQKTGAISLAKELGIATTTLTAATTTDDAARKRLISTLQAQVDASFKYVWAGRAQVKVQSEQGKAAQQLIDILNQTHTSISDTISAYNNVAAAQGMTTYTTGAQKQALSELAAQYGMSVPAFLAAQVAQQQNASQAASTTQQLQMENDAASLLTNAFTLLNGGMLSVAQAQTGAAAAGNTLLDSLSKNGVAIDGNSKEAVANQQALEQKAAADQQAAEAVAKQTGSTEAGTKAFAVSKQALIDQLTAAGNLTPAIQALIDKYYAVPPVVKTKAEMDSDAAAQKAADLKAKLDHIQTVIDIQVTMHENSMATAGVTSLGSRGSTARSGGGAIYRAAGGPAYLAGGGDPWRPQGTDNVRAMLTMGEFVVREPSARQNPGFLKAYNADPARALASVRGQGATTHVSLEGATFVMDIDGQKVTGVIRKQVTRALSSAAVQVQGGATL